MSQTLASGFLGLGRVGFECRGDFPKRPQRSQLLPHSLSYSTVQGRLVAPAVEKCLLHGLLQLVVSVPKSKRPSEAECSWSVTSFLVHLCHLGEENQAVAKEVLVQETSQN